MQTPFTAGVFQPDAALAGAAASFFELLKSFGAQASGPAARPPDWTALAGTLARQFEQWLKASPAMGTAFSSAAGLGPAAGFAPAGFAPGAGFGAASWPPGAVPPGPAAARAEAAPNAWELLVRLAQLQGQLATHWSEIANSSAQKFIARAASGGARPISSDEAVRLYELWVECAEEAYAATVRTEEFCRLQADLANAGAALLLAQRSYAEGLARACGLPTREEADALQRQIRELRAQLEAQAPGAGSRGGKRRKAARVRPKPRAGPRARKSPRQGRRPRA